MFNEARAKAEAMQIAEVARSLGYVAEVSGSSGWITDVVGSYVVSYEVEPYVRFTGNWLAERPMYDGEGWTIGSLTGGDLTEDIKLFMRLGKRPMYNSGQVRLLTLKEFQARGNRHGT